jgi:hypothetical protein
LEVTIPALLGPFFIFGVFAKQQFREEHLMSVIKILKFIFSLDSLGGRQKLRFLFSTNGRRFLADFFEYKKRAKIKDPGLQFREFLPCLNDYDSQSAHLPKHYFYQDLHVANRVFQNNPKRHVDIGSRVDGFVAHVAAFREVEVLDIRPLDRLLYKNIVFKQGDLMGKIDLNDYCDSVSSLHAIEHFGLGRYNDSIDFECYLKGLDNIYKMLKERGKFYFSVPVGKEQTVFNAHRIFSVKYLLELFKPKYIIDSFSYIDDQDKLVIDASISPQDVEKYTFDYGCGIFELTKLARA